MKLIVGLGNPEEKYAPTRHNVGFRVISHFARERDIEFVPKDKFKASVAELPNKNEKVILAKPMTYYNNSGESIRAISDFYKIAPEDILIIHDELVLPFGTVRTRIGGSDAGNNGVKSINAHVGDTTARIRIGIKNEHHIDDIDFVLGKFSAEESKKLDDIQSHVDADIAAFISGNFEATTHSH